MRKSSIFSVDLSDIDFKILPLVIALNQLSITTTASCQGHFDGWMTSRYCFPWVCVEEQDLDKLYELINQYNLYHKVEWKITLNVASKKWLLKPEKDYLNLSFLQLESIRLANFLFEVNQKEC